MTKQGRIEKFRSGLIFPSIALGLAALVAAAMLSGGDILTRDAIRDRQDEDLRASIAQVISPDMYDNNLLTDALIAKNQLGEDVLVYRAFLNGAATGVVFQTSEPGYAGYIVIIMGVAKDGTLLGVRVLSHAETPGLGDKIEVEKDPWILGFEGLSLNNPAGGGWAVKKDGGQFDQFSGATISPRRVVRAVKRGLEFFDANKELLLAAPEEDDN